VSGAGGNPLDNKLLSNILRPRLDELVGDRLSKIDLNGVDATFAAEVKKGMVWMVPQRPMDIGQWLTGDADCLSFLRVMCVGEAPTVVSAEPPPLQPFATSLAKAARDPHLRFRLLTERYLCPLNISFAGDEDIREHLLMRLMVQDRAALEKGAFDAGGSADLFLRLNLIALHAAATSDLRFLDSLNYYYELLPPIPWPEAHHHWLWLSFLVLYSRALEAKI